MTDGIDFELDLNGDLGVVARKMAAEVARLEKQLNALSTAHTKAERSSRAFAKTSAFSGQSWKNIQNHANAVVRLQKSHTALAPASRQAASALRMFGINGGALRKVTIDAAKTEIALRRLYRVKGGGVRGASAVFGSLASRGVARYGGSAAAGVGSAVMGGVGMASSAALAGGAVAAGGVGLLGYSMTKTAIDAERIRFALDRVTNGKEAMWWEKSSGYARDFGMNVNTVAANLMDMKASGFEDSMVETLFGRMGDLRALGATEETIGRATLAIRQVASAGRLQGDELNQLSEAGINANIIYDVLGKKLGKTTAEIIKMKEAGKLTSDIVIPAIAEAIGVKTGGGKAGEAGRAATNSTVSGLWSKMTGSFSVASANAISSDGLAPLRKSISNFTDWINGPGGTSAINGFGGVMTKIFAVAPALIEKVIWLLGEGIPAAWRGFTDGFMSTGAGTALTSMVTGLTDVGGEKGANAANSLAGFGAAAGSLAGNLATLVGWLGNLIGKLATLGEYADTMSYFIPTNWAPKLLSAGIGAISGDSVGGSGVPGATDTGVGNDNGESAPFSVGRSMSTGMSAGMMAGMPAVTDAGRMLAAQARVTGAGSGDSVPNLESTLARLASAPRKETKSFGAPVINMSIPVSVSETQGMAPGEVGEVVGDKMERRLTGLFSQLSYSGVG